MAINSAGGYSILSYDIDMVVNTDNSFDITETITVNFSEPKHGIFQSLPLTNSVTRNNRTKSKNRVKISNISVNETYTTYTENGYKVIKIGDSDHTITGTYTYVISYNYNIGKDPLKKADKLYYNLLGNKCDSTISNITFKITMSEGYFSDAKSNTDTFSYVIIGICVLFLLI